MLLEREGGELFALQPTTGIPKWTGIGQPGPKSNLTRGTGGRRPPPKRNFSPPSKQPEYLAAPLLEIPRRPVLKKKMRKTPVAYPWNPLVALGMGEAN